VDATTDPRELQRLARDPGAPPAILHQIAALGSPVPAMVNLAYNPSAGRDTVSLLLAHPSPAVRKGIARRDDLTDQDYTALATDPSAEVRVALAWRKTLPREARQPLLRSTTTLMAWRGDDVTAADCLAAMSDSALPTPVRQEASRSMRFKWRRGQVPLDAVLTALDQNLFDATDRRGLIACYRTDLADEAAGNPFDGDPPTVPDALDAAQDRTAVESDRRQFDRDKVPPAPADLLARLATDEDEWVLVNVVDHPNCPPEVAATVLNRGSARIRQRVAQRADLSEEVLQVLAHDRAESVTHALLSEDGRIEWLLSLDDEDLIVGLIARMRLDLFVREVKALGVIDPREQVRAISVAREGEHGSSLWSANEVVMQRYLAEPSGLVRAAYGTWLPKSVALTAEMLRDRDPRARAAGARRFGARFSEGHDAMVVDLTQVLEGTDSVERVRVVTALRERWDLVRVLAGDESWKVRAAVASHPLADLDTLTVLSEDPSKAVRKAASKTLIAALARQV
jgi:hypothetical protein